MKQTLFLIVAAAFAAVGDVAIARAAEPPTVAVYGFGASASGGGGGSGFDPGEALSDLLTDRLVDLGTLSVVDRQHLQQVLAEQRISQEGDVTPATEAQIGQMLGVRYLIIGEITQFGKVGGSTMGGGGLMPHIPFIGGGSLGTSKTELSVSVRIVEANSGRIVQSIEDDRSATVASVNLTGAGDYGSGTYSSQQFESSDLGKLFSAVADDVAKKVAIPAAPSEPAISGHVVGIDGDAIVLNIGSSKGVSVGMMFTAADVKEFPDPDNPGKMISSEIPKGTLQITSISDGSSIAQKISGTVKAGQIVHLEQ
ncbi:MAG TPA: CsgG/HfaB family protein [Candidatus Acidoferrales bacterium]|nr:CsgG/HfaB family protein [Candidatus Acidoferrales bacterium]